MRSILKIKFILTAFLLSLAAPATSFAELHTFTDTEGRTLRAEIVSATDSKVKIRREDGQVFEVPLTTLAAADRKYVQDWQQEQVKNAPLRLRVEVSQSKKMVGRSDSASSTTRTIEAGYRILIKNESVTSLDNLKIEYRVFKFADSVGLSNSKRPMNKIAGSIRNVSVPRFGQREYATDAVTLVIDQLKPNWRYTNGADPRTADSLAGLWIRLLNSDGDVVHEYASSETLKAEGW